MLNVHQLNVFIVASETLNFTNTAKKLHLTQSSVSQHIKSLETQLNVPLFERKGRSIELSDAGKVLLPLAREVVEGSIRAEEKMELLQENVHGHIIVGCNTAPGKYILPLLLAKFHQEYPMVRITCQVLPHQQAIGKLSEGKIHFALTNTGDKQQLPSDFQLYLQEPILLITPEDHPWAEKGRISPQELLKAKYIMRESKSGTYQHVKRALQAINVDIERLSTVMEMGTSEAVAIAVEQGLGVGFVSELIMTKICRGNIAMIEVDGLNIVQDIYFGRQTFLPTSSAQAVFWDFIRKHAPDILQRPLMETDSIPAATLQAALSEQIELAG